MGLTPLYLDHKSLDTLLANRSLMTAFTMRFLNKCLPCACHFQWNDEGENFSFYFLTINIDESPTPT